jgi:NADP-dependent 3-hydroxy acid dehydrogenase YdfG
MTSSTLGTALVTGASGIGALYADRLARRGHDLVLVARNRERLNHLARDISNRTGRSVEVLVADLHEPAALATVEDVLRRDASITLLVNNAGVGTHRALLDSDVDEMTRMVALNVTAPMRLAYAAVPGFVARGAAPSSTSPASSASRRNCSTACTAAARPSSPPSASRCTTSWPTRACACRPCCRAPPPPTSGPTAACRWSTWTAPS